MKTIKLSNGKETIVDNEDFEWIKDIKLICGKNGYVYIYKYSPVTKKNKLTLLHRSIMEATKGINVDHKNGNSLDNRKENLRFCDQRLNNGNSRKPKHNTSGYKGVGWCKAANKWEAHISKNNKTVHLGIFSNINDAINTYKLEAKKYFGEFARTE